MSLSLSLSPSFSTAANFFRRDEKKKKKMKISVYLSKLEKKNSREHRFFVFASSLLHALLYSRALSSEPRASLLFAVLLAEKAAETVKQRENKETIVDSVSLALKQMTSSGGGFSFDLCSRNATLESRGVVAPRLKKTGTTIVGLVYKVRVFLERGEEEVDRLQ